jgi:hypothetical protein
MVLGLGLGDDVKTVEIKDVKQFETEIRRIISSINPQNIKRKDELIDRANRIAVENEGIYLKSKKVTPTIMAKLNHLKGEKIANFVEKQLKEILRAIDK